MRISTAQLITTRVFVCNGLARLDSTSNSSSSSHHFQKRLRRMAQYPPRGVYQADLAIHIHLAYLHFVQNPLADLLVDAHAWQESHALIALHHLADRLDRRHLQ